MSLQAGPFSSAGIALHPVSEQHPRLSIDSYRPYIGLVGVMLGAVMATLGSRVTSFGLADLRGALGAGYDEGAWITTSFAVGQMLIGVTSPYLGAVFGVRRILLLGIILFFVASLLAPFSPNLAAFLTMQFLAGVGSGTFIPLTISFIVRSLPVTMVIYGIAIYAMNIELSLNVAASLEGWYSDNWSWAWISWQYCVMLPVMAVCVWHGVPREEIKTDLLRRFDWPGVAYAAIGFSLLYAGLDQGNRLDWINNGMISALLASGSLLTVAFIVRELGTDHPFINIRLIFRENLVLLLLLLAGFRFIILSTAYIIPTYLQTVQNFRELQVGSVLLWIALPQLLIVIPLGALLRRVDGRWVLAIGAAVVGVACLMATNLTSQWATSDFLPSQILQALGQSFALTALVVLIVRSINPAEALTIGALIQISRLFGGEIGTAFMQTYVRLREQLHSNLIGLHIDGIAGLTLDRIAAFRIASGLHTSDPAAATAQATSLLATAVARQAAVLSFIDGFSVAALGALACVFLVAMMQKGKPAPF
ncbi:MFS transporter [Phyllobacterium sp. SYP-B3895]|uniref:MFS transporter n=1 Tax=Phyllobacterium sp. SYP-B3895 TaxID=2663240 RepID=UPI00129975CC|nr:MFS transporter [Phyllobacterium sp. SYP-B3895]